MATIREKAPYQWQVQIRRMGWPNQNATFRTKKDAEAWARKILYELDHPVGRGGKPLSELLAGAEQE